MAKQSKRNIKNSLKKREKLLKGIPAKSKYAEKVARQNAVSRDNRQSQP